MWFVEKLQRYIINWSFIYGIKIMIYFSFRYHRCFFRRHFYFKQNSIHLIKRSIIFVHNNHHHNNKFIISTNPLIRYRFIGFWLRFHAIITSNEHVNNNLIENIIQLRFDECAYDVRVNRESNKTKFTLIQNKSNSIPNTHHNVWIFGNIIDDESYCDIYWLLRLVIIAVTVHIRYQVIQFC